jgi:hypothetical protein
LNRYISLYEGLSDSSLDSLSDVQAARETCCETKWETVKEESFTPPFRMYLAMEKEIWRVICDDIFGKVSLAYSVQENSIQGSDSLLGRQELARTTPACSQMAL